MERPDDEADGRHVRRVMAIGSPHAQRLNCGNFGDLHLAHAVRRSGILAPWAPRQCWASPTTAAERCSWLHDRHTRRWCCCARDGHRLEEAGVTAMDTRGLSARFTMSAAGCECVLHASIGCAGLSGPSTAVMARLGHGRTTAGSGFLGDAGCLRRTGIFWGPGSWTCVWRCVTSEHLLPF